MKDVVAVVLRVVGDPFQVFVRSISSEQTPTLSQDCLDNQACVVQLSRAARRDALVRADYFKAHAVSIPPWCVKALLSIRLIKFGALSFKVVSVSLEFIPFLDGYTLVSATPIIWAINQAVDGVALVFEITKPREVVFVLVGYKDTTELLVSWKQM